MIKAVALDLDDTFTLTEAACFEMENEVLKSIGRSPMSREIHLKTWGQPLFEIIHERSPGVDVAAFESAFPPIKEKYVSSGKLDSIPPENYQALDELIKAGKQIYVLTSRNHTEIHHLLEPDHLLASRVKTFYYKDNMKFHKPDPRAFLKLFEDTGFKPRECVYVGDSPRDAETANSAKVLFVASLESGIRNKSDFSKFKVNEYIYKFPEIVEAVAKLDSVS